MTLEDLKGYMRNPQTLPKSSIEELERLRDAYPYSSALSFLYLLALAYHKDIRYASELKKLAPFLPDRGRLYRLVEMGEQSFGVGQGAGDREDPFALIDSYLERARMQGEDLPTDLLLGFEVDRDDYLGAAQDMGWAVAEVAGGGAEPRAGDKTAETQGAVAPDKEGKAPEGKDATPFAEGGGQTQEIEDGLFTETLAKIYIKQGKYDRALRIIRSISLHYPQKNRYFAEQIRFLELLITNENEHTK